MKHLQFRFANLIAAAICILQTSSLQAQVKVSGITYQIDNAGNYQVLPGVTIQAYRAGPLLKNPVISKTDGTFEFQVPDGEPFDVSFHGNSRVPELTQIAGNSKAPKNVINIALYTREQYKKVAKERNKPPLNNRLNCMLKEVPEDSEFAREIRSLLLEK